ncbi:hypothetical protein PsYK624_056910 [Phanerochaete sordida]|uniref:Uncharacterized protein n=1 Tax=Phanerochaete sordida TaxID=48140 RepID=A0A9P3G5I1_9APHY|nr:hypothetical protein PsYK624_056910 [Phanerochaete sordida]
MSSKRSFEPPKATPKSFRDVPVSKRSIWESWAVLPAKTRLTLSLAITGFAALGLFMSDQLEKSLPEPRPAPAQPAHNDATRT